MFTGCTFYQEVRLAETQTNAHPYTVTNQLKTPHKKILSSRLTFLLHLLLA